MALFHKEGNAAHHNRRFEVFQTTSSSGKMKHHKIPAIALLAFFISGKSHGAVVYQSITYDVGFEGIAYFDLDGNSTNDIRLDVGYPTMLASDFAYIVRPIGTTLIPASGGITTSFSSGDLVTLTDLQMIGNDSTAFTGGYIPDNLGNFVCAGWGGVTFDEIGNPIIPPGGPTHQIDYFLVKLDEGAAWIHLDSRDANLGLVTANWGYISPIESTFAITNIPEPSAVTAASLGCMGLLIRRRKVSDLRHVIDLKDSQSNDRFHYLCWPEVIANRTASEGVRTGGSFNTETQRFSPPSPATQAKVSDASGCPDNANVSTSPTNTSSP